jgi:hypothetical protein
MTVDDSLLSRIDWKPLLKRLAACAEKWFLQEGCCGEESVLPATGKSAKELAFDAVIEFIKGKIEFHPESEETAGTELYIVLRKVMRNDFLDLVKKGRAYQRTDVLDATKAEESKWGEYSERPTMQDLADPSDEGFYELEAAAVARRIAPLLEDDPELKEYADAVLRSKSLKREDIATSIGISPQEATNRQRRLRVRLASWYRSIKANRS